MTYSIIAWDAETSRFGVAVQSHFLGVGRAIPWAEAGVGAVATQSFVEPAYGALGLELLRSGMSARQALDALLAADSARDLRQVGILDARGSAAAHTGRLCIADASHAVAPGVSVQANMVASAEVVPAMLDAYSGSSGHLADRLLSALDAAESAGGDIRGKQSAALLVVSGSGPPWRQVEVDARVDDHPEPLRELRRLVRCGHAYGDLVGWLMREGLMMGPFQATPAETEGALRAFEAAQRTLPDNLEPTVWAAVLLARAGRTAEARSAMERATRAHPPFGEFLMRLADVGFLPGGRAEASAILSGGSASRTS